MTLPARGVLLGPALALVTACEVGEPEPVFDEGVGYSVALPTLFEHPGFAGESFTIDGTTDFVGGAWNDRISAVLVPDGATVVLYEHAGFEGNRLDLVAPGVVNLGDFGFNDQISSIEVHGLFDLQPRRPCDPREIGCAGDSVFYCDDYYGLSVFNCAENGAGTCEGSGSEAHCTIF